MGYRLGIDLGTTYTAAAVCRSSDRRWVEPEVVTLGGRAGTIPSVLFVNADGSVLVGDAAERRAVTDPDRVVREFKRRLGDPTPLVVGGTPWTPEELSARLVRWVVDRVAEREGAPAERVALTHPASWGGHKRELLAAALAGQGLTVTFLPEPQAAALHYAAAERVPAGSTIAVYDLGGGTFDAAVVRKADGAFTPLGRPEGIERLGGVDFDEAVFEHVRAGLPAAFEGLDDTDPGVLAAVARLRRECTEAKEALSADTEVSIPVLMPGAQGSVRLHRGEFEALIRERVEDTVAALRRAVASAGLTPDELSAVLLVGGSSRIPLVAQLVSEQLGRPIAVDADPKYAIAKGAALAVSPRPTASWPDVAVPPVVAAAAAVPPPPQTAALPPEPATSVLPPPVAAAWRDPAPQPDREYEVEPAQPRRSPGLFVGAGGALAVAAVLVAVLFWPTADPSPRLGTSTGGGAVPVTTQPEPAPGPVVAPEPEPQPVRDRPDRVRPEPDPPAVTTEPPVTTTPPTETSTTVPPTGTTTTTTGPTTETTSASETTTDEEIPSDVAVTDPGDDGQDGGDGVQDRATAEIATV